MTTQDSSLSPPRSLVMVGSAVDTMVWSSAASSIVSMSAPRMRRRWRRLASLLGVEHERRRAWSQVLQVVGEAADKRERVARSSRPSRLGRAGERGGAVGTGVREDRAPGVGDVDQGGPAVVGVGYAGSRSRRPRARAGDG